MILQRLYQKTIKDITDFLSRVTQVVQGKVAYEGAREALICEFVWEGLNKEHRAAVTSVQLNDEILDDKILTWQDIGTHFSQIDKLAVVHIQSPIESA